MYQSDYIKTRLQIIYGLRIIICAKNTEKCTSDGTQTQHRGCRMQDTEEEGKRIAGLKLGGILLKGVL